MTSIVSETEIIALCQNKEFLTSDIELFKKAFSFTKEQYQDEKRNNGELRIQHNIHIAQILIENNALPEVVVAGILHGLEKRVFPTDISKEFGDEIANLVFGQNQLSSIKAKNKEVEADSLRQILLVTLKDPRIIFVKLASKLDNLDSIQVFTKEKQKQIIKEVHEIYAPLANRLGAEKIRLELERKAFKIENPKKYNEIKTFLKESEQIRNERIEKIIEKATQILKPNIKSFKIKGRPKHIFSIYKKMQTKNLTLHKDHLAIRIIVETIDDCYKVLGYVHKEFTPLDGSLKDYIANPKPNFYRSIHTVVDWGKHGNVEIQIRTFEMDEEAEEGISAHWNYKKLKSNPRFEMKTAWLRSLIDLRKDTQSKEFLDTIKVDLFNDRFYCYTPKGKAIDLPKGATVLDFAYHIHQAVGDQAVGGRINGKFVPLRTELPPESVVEIVTNKHQRPRRDWIKIVISAKAKQKVRSGVKRFEGIPVTRYHRIKPKEVDHFDSLAFSEHFPSMNCVLTKCCFPVPNEEIIGIITKRNEISIHTPQCKQALREQERWIEVFWKDSFNRLLQINVIAKNRSGILADLVHTIAQTSVSVKEAKAKLIGGGEAECSFTLTPLKLELLTLMVQRINKVKGVKRIAFS